MPRCPVCIVMTTQRRKRAKAIEHFGGKCTRCGYSRCIDALEFHHLDENEKEQEASYIIRRWAWERAKLELEKCVLLCANCHREEHASLNKRTASINGDAPDS